MKVLTPEAEYNRAVFYSEYGTGNCSCHICAPCSSCTHPGNPVNQEEDPWCWMEITDEAWQALEPRYPDEAEGPDEAGTPQNHAIAPIRPGEEL